MEYCQNKSPKKKSCQNIKKEMQKKTWENALKVLFYISEKITIANKK